MKITYEIRTVRNTPVHSFDTLECAKMALPVIEKRVRAKMRLVKITHVEEEVQ